MHVKATGMCPSTPTTLTQTKKSDIINLEERCGRNAYIYSLPMQVKINIFIIDNFRKIVLLHFVLCVQYLIFFF